MARILLAEDHSVIRQRLKALLVLEPGFRVVAEAGDGLDATRLASELAPDVLVLDLTMPGLHGLEVARRLRHQVPRTRVVIVSIHGDEPYVAAAFRHGVLGYVRKDEAGQHLVPAVRAALAGRQYLSASLAGFATRLGRRQRTTHPSRIGALRPRERFMLRLAAQGSSDAEIAAQLKLTSAQASLLRARLMRRLKVRTRGQLAAWAARHAESATGRTRSGRLPGRSRRPDSLSAMETTRTTRG